MPIAFLFLLTLWSPLHAQYSEQPEKESTTDLRSQSVLFSVEIVDDKKVYVLERTSGMDHFLRTKIKDQENIVKVTSREAQKLDLNFASRFLKCQYELPTAEGKCKVEYKLMMKGESQEICGKDDKKAQEIKAFLTELSQRI